MSFRHRKEFSDDEATLNDDSSEFVVPDYTAETAPELRRRRAAADSEEAIAMTTSEFVKQFTWRSKDDKKQGRKDHKELKAIFQRCGVTVKKFSKDSDSLFTAISDQLRRQLIDTDAATLKKGTIDYLREHRKDYERIIEQCVWSLPREQYNRQTFSTFIKWIRDGQVVGEEIILKALADITRMSVCVFDADSRSIGFRIDPSTPSPFPPLIIERRSNRSSEPAFYLSVRLKREIDFNEYTETRRFPDSHPQASRIDETTADKHKYFWDAPASFHGRPFVAVIVPFYNEEAEVLEKTLLSLAIQRQEVMQSCGTELKVFLIQDGWKNSSHSMREYMKELFPSARINSLAWWYRLDRQQAEPETLIIARTENGHVKEIDIRRKQMCKEPRIAARLYPDPRQPTMLHVTLMVKRDNRKKHNSHEWFFQAFCKYYNPRYCFATDCATLFERRCLLDLVNFMEKPSNRRVSACTGRQRVMTKEQQESEESYFSFENWYRQAQCYDYESSFASYMGAFALFGFLPVIPGPCGLYRWERINGKPLEWYFSIVNAHPGESVDGDEVGLILGNLKIAEDRILTYSAVLKTQEESWLSIVPTATFYFEAETSLETLALQRRRWTNGTVAGYIYLCFMQPGLILDNHNLSWMRRIFIFLLLICQMIMYAVVSISPALFLASFNTSLQLVFSYASHPMYIIGETWSLLVLLYILFVLWHSYNRFEGWMFYTLLLMGPVIMVVNVAAAQAYVLLQIYEGTVFDLSSLISNVVLLFVFAIMVLPIFIALFFSPTSCFLMLKTVIGFYAFLPTLVGWFGAYSFSRTFDLSWGNRPGGEVDAKEEGKQLSGADEEEAELQKAKREENKKREDKYKKEIDALSKTWNSMIILANLTVIVLVSRFGLTIPMFVLVFLFGVIQMFFSIIYLVGYIPRRLFSAVVDLCSKRSSTYQPISNGGTNTTPNRSYQTV